MFRSRLVPIFILALTLAGCASLYARDMSEYGRYLGVRLRMFQESYDQLDKSINNGTPAEKRKARQYKAEVMRTEADHQFAIDGDADKQREKYLEAIKAFGEGAPDTAQGSYDKAKLQLDIAMVLQRSAPDEARALCDEAIIECDKQRKELEKIRDSGNQAEWTKVYKLYCKLFYTYCYGHYVKALTYPNGHENREPLLGACEKSLAEFQFGTERDQGTTEEEIYTFELQGDIELARGKPESAVGKYLMLKDFLEQYNANAYVGRFALENSYLRAVQLLTNDLDYDQKFLNQVIELYAQAFARYGTVKGLEYQFKTFLLYRISAQIKLGDSEKFQGAIHQLFLLAEDRDATFRRQAVTVLADIAIRDKLDNELRFRCATAACKDLDGMAVSVLLRLAQAHQALLASCSDVQTFETYGPACFERTGNIYARMWRFLDAALVYREGATRTAYFMSKFTEESQVPAHMQGRTALIVDGKTLYKFPSEMANLYRVNAKLLLDPKFGEPGNREFQALLDHAEIVKATLGGEEALLDKEYNDAFKVYQNSQFVQAAVRFANLPGTYRKYYLAMALASTTYYRAALISSTPRVTGGANAAERESDAWFATQKSRHPEGMAALPESMWKGHEAHWDVVMKGETTGPLATWHKMVYYFKRYFLVEAARAWNDIGPLLAENPKPDYIDGILAVAQHKSVQWQRVNPSGAGEPDADLGRIGKALFYYASMLRTPPGKDAALLNEYSQDVIRILGPYLKLFDKHLDDPVFKKASMSLSFQALADAGNVSEAEAAYVAYKEAFPEDDLAGMSQRLYVAVRDNVIPQITAMSTVSTSLQSLANQLRKNLYATIGPSFVEDAKKLAAAKADFDKQKVLADHFWNEWVMNQVFAGKYAADIKATLPDVEPALKQKFDELSTSFPKLWGEAVRAELNNEIKKDTYKAVADAVNKATAGIADTAIMDKLRELRDTDTKNQALAGLYSSLELATKELRYFQGAAFNYEFAAFLQKAADDVNDRYRPRLSFYLKYLQEYLVRSGKGSGSLTQEDVRRVGKQYFMVGDWNQAVVYLQEYVTKYGTIREYGPEEDIFVDTRMKTIGRGKSGDELEAKYLLGKAYLERYKLNNDVEDLRKAALLMRRCWCFNLIRDANELGTVHYTLQFKKEMEDYYLYIGQSMAEIYKLLFAAKTEVKITWPKYVNRYTADLTIHKESPVQAVPADKPATLWESGDIQLRLWSSFMQLEPRDQYKYRSEFRDAFIAWLEFNILWVETYGNKDMGIPKLKGGGLDKYFQEVLNAGRNEQEIGSVFMNESTKAYVAKVKELTSKLEAACKKANITLAR